MHKGCSTDAKDLHGLTHEEDVGEGTLDTLFRHSGDLWPLLKHHISVFHQEIIYSFSVIGCFMSVFKLYLGYGFISAGM